MRKENNFSASNITLLNDEKNTKHILLDI